MGYLKYLICYLSSALCLQILLFFHEKLLAGAIVDAPVCEGLQTGQYSCLDPVIDMDSQSEVGCDQTTRTVSVDCMPAENITCKSPKHNGDLITFNGTMAGFSKNVSCRWTNGYSFETALLLSVFLGMFGIDRFYLGYPAIGLLKFSTLGFFFLGQLVDILLIAAQVVKPSDGSDYIIDFYGARVTRISMNSETFIQPPNS